MKFPLPAGLALALLLAACSTPETKEAKHQRQLGEEARLNFLALKAREHKRAPRVATNEPFITPAPIKPVAAPKPTPTPRPFVLMKPFAPAKPVAAVKPKPTPKPAVPAKPAAPVKLVAATKPKPKPKPAVLAKPAVPVKPVAARQPKPIPPAKPVAKAKPAPPAKPERQPQTIARVEKPRRLGDTIYLWDMPAASSAHYSAAEVNYARKVGKKPSQLTPGERQWVREHF